MQEVWKKIKEYGDYYYISNLGRVKSLKRNKISYLKGRMDSNGYLIAHFYFNKKAINHSIHRLVAIYFLPNIKNYPQVNHKNGLKNDNRVENLEWVSISQNEHHKHSILFNKKRGIRYNKIYNTWTAIIRVDKKNIYLGSFKTEEKAYQSFYRAYFKFHGVIPWTTDNSSNRSV